MLERSFELKGVREILFDTSSNVYSYQWSYLFSTPVERKIFLILDGHPPYFLHRERHSGSSLHCCEAIHLVESLSTTHIQKRSLTLSPPKSFKSPVTGNPAQSRDSLESGLRFRTTSGSPLMCARQCVACQLVETLAKAPGPSLKSDAIFPEITERDLLGHGIRVLEYVAMGLSQNVDTNNSHYRRTCHAVR